MSINELLPSFGWSGEAALALARAEQAVERLCHPQTGYRPVPREIDLGLEGGRGSSLLAVVQDACVALESCGYAARHPQSLAHMVPPPATVSVIGDFLKAAANQCAFTVQQGPLAPALEQAVLRWLGATLGFPEGSGGMLTSGGTVSNYAAAFLALDRARRTWPPNAKPCVIATDQAHFSIAKAARLIGLGEKALFRAPTGPDGRLDPGAVAKTVGRAELRGYRPFLFVCTGGTTNAGLMEPVEPFAEEAAKAGAWLHIDGAHGGFRALASAPPQDYWTRANSVAWDPHKTMFVPFPAGALILRDPGAAAALAHRPDYAFQEVGAPDPALAHIEGSRGLDALKIWMTIRHFGRDGLRAIADHLLALGGYLAKRVASDRRFELIASPDTNIVCFRWIETGGTDVDAINRAIQAELYEEGHTLLSRTRLGGRLALRAVIQNPLTTERDLDALLAAVVASAMSLVNEADTPADARRFARSA
ncbi:MAG TPA: pyridoxal-dependent decarboxylase [Allosphingosinicella sp.]|jgi:L-2,4-diaminobutyrate decarboxylase